MGFWGILAACLVVWALLVGLAWSCLVVGARADADAEQMEIDRRARTLDMP
jgi:hypothetical protein